MFERRTLLPVGIEVAFDLSLNIDAHVGSMTGSDERAVGGVTAGIIGLGLGCSLGMSRQSTSRHETDGGQAALTVTEGQRSKIDRSGVSASPVTVCQNA